MAKITEVLDRMASLAITTQEAHGLLGSMAVIAPDALTEALDHLEAKRRREAVETTVDGRAAA